mmetsp:Transcript_70217/g.154840  ORF Transcript_70217/g.154840 Transcript_70217/m.154840 type:complete len:106 (+) Transcript_70217:47-364(+)
MHLEDYSIYNVLPCLALKPTETQARVCSLESFKHAKYIEIQSNKLLRQKHSSQYTRGQQSQTKMTEEDVLAAAFNIFYRAVSAQELIECCICFSHLTKSAGCLFF